MNSIEKQIRELLDTHPQEVITAFLNYPVWPPHINVREAYRRFEDDSPKGVLTVAFGVDSDSWIEVISKPDPDEIGSSMFRFRTHAGGGKSLKVRAALLVLAEAIRQDNAEHPQHHDE
jgi:hypothetical protein